MKNRMREIRTSGSVRDGDGDIPVYSARRFNDRPGSSVRFVKLVVAAEGVSLQDPRPGSQMLLWMLTAPIRRVVKHGGRRG